MHVLDRATGEALSATKFSHVTTTHGVVLATGRPQAIAEKAVGYISGRLPNRPTELVGWIRDPQGVEPGSAMPNRGIAADDARHGSASLHPHRRAVMRRRTLFLLLSLHGQSARADDYGAVATAARLARPAREEPAVVTVIDREEIARNPTLTSDTLLRIVPSALTFRRSTSLVADPSSQGLNLRGIGPSAVARTLLLVDGVPANDPFSGSIYFRALPRLGLGRIEIVPSGSSALYGSAALSGVVAFLPRPLLNEVDAEASYGGFSTAQAAVRLARCGARIGGAVEAEVLNSDGFVVVAPEQRGPIDSPADSRHVSVNARLEAAPREDVRLAATVRLFEERQNGGTRYTTSGVKFGLATMSATITRRNGSLEARVFGRLQRFEQERARIAVARVREDLAARQDVPANDQGGSLIFQSRSLSLLGRHRLGAGVDVRRVAGISEERLFPPMPTVASLRAREAGGEQIAVGGFLQELYGYRDFLQLDLTLRADSIRNREGKTDLTFESGHRQRSEYEARSASALSPRAGLLVRPHETLAMRASGYRAFRAPTLNELYRAFQIGTVLTAANPKLGPEILAGFEAGIEWTPYGSAVLRATGFYNHLDRPISNVTLPMPLADGTQRERQNLGSAVVRGLETSAEYRWSSGVIALVGYTLALSEVRDAGSMRELRNKELAQAPRHRATFRSPTTIDASRSARPHRYACSASSTKTTAISWRWPLTRRST